LKNLNPAFGFRFLDALNRPNNNRSSVDGGGSSGHRHLTPCYTTLALGADTTDSGERTFWLVSFILGSEEKVSIASIKQWSLGVRCSEAECS